MNWTIIWHTLVGFGIVVAGLAGVIGVVMLTDMLPNWIKITAGIIGILIILFGAGYVLSLPLFSNGQIN